MKRIFFLIMTMLISTFSAFAQIQGNVIDTAGKSIPGAIIIAFDSVKNTVDTIKSDKIGYYAYKNLKIGKYKITVRASGFQNAVHENIIVINETPDDDEGGDDISNAIWLEIVLKRSKLLK